jgi:hypothetical protein
VANAGISTDVSPVQFLNESIPTEAEMGIFIDVIKIQFSNAELPMLVTLFGIVIYERFLQL